MTAFKNNVTDAVIILKILNSVYKKPWFPFKNLESKILCIQTTTKFSINTNSGRYTVNMNPGRYTINVNSGRYIYTGSDPAPKIGTEVECTRRAIIWLQRLQERYNQPAIDTDNLPQWVDEILSMPWMEGQIPMAKRYRAYRRFASHFRYTKHRMLPKQLVMAIRCRYPEPSGVYTGYIHTIDEASDQEDETPEGDTNRNEDDQNADDLETSSIENKDTSDDDDDISYISWELSEQEFPNSELGENLSELNNSEDSDSFYQKGIFLEPSVESSENSNNNRDKDNMSILEGGVSSDNEGIEDESMSFDARDNYEAAQQIITSRPLDNDQVEALLLQLAITNVEKFIIIQNFFANLDDK